MKKWLVLITLAMVAALALALVGCSGDSTKASDNYDVEKADLVSSIDSMNDSALSVADIELKTWDVVGADNFSDFIQQMLSTKTLSQYLNNFYYYKPLKQIVELEKYQDAILGTSFSKAENEGQKAVDEQRTLAVNLMTEFSNNYDNVTTKNKELQAVVKEFKDKYEKSHKESVDNIVEYYLKSSSLADAVSNPSGSLITFSSDVKELKSDVETLKRKVELD